MKAVVRHPSTIQRLVWSAMGATRCREEAVKCDDPETVASLMRAASRYSRQVSEFADALAREPMP